MDIRIFGQEEKPPLLLVFYLVKSESATFFNRGHYLFMVHDLAPLGRMQTNQLILVSRLVSKAGHAHIKGYI